LGKSDTKKGALEMALTWVANQKKSGGSNQKGRATKKSTDGAGSDQQAKREKRKLLIKKRERNRVRRLPVNPRG